MHDAEAVRKLLERARRCNTPLQTVDSAVTFVVRTTIFADLAHTVRIVPRPIKRIRPMARVTVEDCLVHAPNRFALIHLAAKRALQLKRDAEPLVDRVENKEIVTSLREIAEQKVVFDIDVDEVLSGRIHKKERKRTRRRRR